MMDTDDWEEMMDMKEQYIAENIYATFNNVIAWAEDRNILEGSTTKDQLAKLIQELGEVSDAICKSDTVQVKKELGDMLVIMTIIARMHQLSIPECAEAAYNKIKDRKGIMFDGVFIKDTDVEYEDLLRKLGKYIEEEE